MLVVLKLGEAETLGSWARLMLGASRRLSVPQKADGPRLSVGCPPAVRGYNWLSVISKCQVTRSQSSLFQDTSESMNTFKNDKIKF